MAVLLTPLPGQYLAFRNAAKLLGVQKVGEFGLGEPQLTTTHGSQAEGFEDFIGEFASVW